MLFNVSRKRRQTAKAEKDGEVLAATVVVNSAARTESLRRQVYIYQTSNHIIQHGCPLRLRAREARAH
jgi:hypothetical protein